MKLERLETPGIAHFSYLLADGASALVVDPRRDIEIYLRKAQEFGVQITHVLETHRQEDFVMGSAQLVRVTGAQVVNGTHECFGRGDVRLEDGDEFDFGSLRVKALSTPGHTPESMCYAVFSDEANAAWCVFTGDTLFFGETGRTDLPDAAKSVENAALLYDSVHEKLADLGDTALVMPAHGPGSVCGSGMAERPMSTLGEEKQYNVVFTKDRDTFAREKGSERLPRPPYFRIMERVNLEGGKPLEKPLGMVSMMDPEKFARGMTGTTVYDTREPEAFAGGHVEGAYSIWLGGLPVFGGWMADENDPVMLVTDRGEDVAQAAVHLARIGLDNIVGALADGFGNWRKSGQAVQRSGAITPTELSAEGGACQILDVREPDEFAAAHIKGAKSLYVGHLEDGLASLDLDKQAPVVVTCGVGHRAGLGVSILQRAGFQDVRNLIGGMSAWLAMGLPVEEGD